MNSQTLRLARRYTDTLKEYLAEQNEAGLERACALGRFAIARGLGVLNMARFHQEALSQLWSIRFLTADPSRTIKAAEVFFLESLSPFEATHRGFRETATKLQERNRQMELEIAERRRTELALRELFNEARRMEDSLRVLSSQILHAQEEERKRISRELHDEVGQALTAISMTLASLNHLEPSATTALERKVADAQCLLRTTMETVHDFARELRPAMLDELGLLPALRSYLKGFAARTGVRVSFRGDGSAESLGGEQKTVLFRVAQESLNNVAKHAHASRVTLVIRKLGPDICMEVKDNGRSFRETPILPAGNKWRLGFVGMQERVRLVNGIFAVKPQLGKGTTVRVLIPSSRNGIKLNKTYDSST